MQHKTLSFRPQRSEAHYKILLFRPERSGESKVESLP
jgi:hypothetical protein